MQPFILLSGSPPSEPLRFLNSATRFIILARETPERGKVSIGSSCSVWRVSQVKA